jgi:hypothetical protein
MSPVASLAVPVLVARRGELLLALPVETVGNAGSLPCTPPPPWSPEWVAGLALRGEDVLPAIDALPGGPVAAPGRPRLLVIATTTPAWALVIDGVEGMATATATGDPVPRLTLPSAWAHAGRLGDGRAALLIVPQRIADHLTGAVAVSA